MDGYGVVTVNKDSSERITVPFLYDLQLVGKVKTAKVANGILKRNTGAFPRLMQCWKTGASALRVVNQRWISETSSDTIHSWQDKKRNRFTCEQVSRHANDYETVRLK